MHFTNFIRICLKHLEQNLPLVPKDFLWDTILSAGYRELAIFHLSRLEL